MKRIMQWANFRGKSGDVRAYPMVLDGAGLAVLCPVPEGAELFSVTTAVSAGIDDDGLAFYMGKDPEEWVKQKETAEATRAARAAEKAARTAEDERAKSIVLANPNLSLRKVVAVLQSHNIARGVTWVSYARRGERP